MGVHTLLALRPDHWGHLADAILDGAAKVVELGMHIAPAAPMSAPGATGVWEPGPVAGAPPPPAAGTGAVVRGGLSVDVTADVELCVVGAGAGAASPPAVRVGACPRAQLSALPSGWWEAHVAVPSVKASCGRISGPLGLQLAIPRIINGLALAVRGGFLITRFSLGLLPISSMKSFFSPQDLSEVSLLATSSPPPAAGSAPAVTAHVAVRSASVSVSTGRSSW